MSHCGVINRWNHSNSLEKWLRGLVRVSSISADVTYCVYYILRDNQHSEALRVCKPRTVLLENISSNAKDKWQAPDDAPISGEDCHPYLPYHHEWQTSESASSSKSEDGPRWGGRARGPRLRQDEPQGKDSIWQSLLRPTFRSTMSLQEW